MQVAHLPKVGHAAGLAHAASERARLARLNVCRRHAGCCFRLTDTSLKSKKRGGEREAVGELFGGRIGSRRSGRLEQMLSSAGKGAGHQQAFFDEEELDTCARCGAAWAAWRDVATAPFASILYRLSSLC